MSNGGKLKANPIRFEDLRPGMVIRCENIMFTDWADPALPLVVERVTGHAFEDRWETWKVRLLNLQDRRSTKTRVFWVKDQLRLHVVDATGAVSIADLLKVA